MVKTNEIAAKIFDEVKKYFVEQKKENEKNPYIEFRVSMYGYEKRTYGIRLSNKYDDFCELDNCIDVENVFKDLRKMFDTLKTKRGYKYLQYTTDVFFKYPCEYFMINRITLFDEPCKEFVKLHNYITKYANYNIGTFKLFSVNMFGKRGELDCENGKRHYLAHSPKKCEYYLTKLKEVKNSKDIITCDFKEEELLDEKERCYSEYAEVECYGELISYLKVNIKTPKGKNKLSIKIY